MVIRYFFFTLLLMSNVVIANNSIVTDIVAKNYKSAVEVSGNDISVFQRQLITVHIELLTNEEFSYLDVEELNTNDFIIDVGLLKDTHKDSMFKKSIRVFIWPLKAGEHSLSLPTIKLILSGRSIHEIKLKPLQIQVSRLPDYLPPGFPVGELKITSDYSAGTFFPFILTPGELSNYSINLTTAGIHPSLIPDYTTYLQHDSISQLAGSQVTESFEYDLNYSYSKNQSIPIISKYSGLSRFNEFTVLFFEPVSKKINSLDFDSVVMITLNTVFKLILLLCIFFFLYHILVFMVYCKEFIQRRRQYWKKIQLASNATELSHSLRYLQPIMIGTKNAASMNNLSLLHWASLWQDEVLSRHAEALIEQQFSNASSMKFETCKHQLIKRLKSFDYFMFYLYTGKVV